MDKLDRMLRDYCQRETYICTDTFVDRLGAVPKKSVRRLPGKRLAAVAAVCCVLAIGVASGGFRLFYPGVGFTEAAGAYYIAEQTWLGECVVDSAIWADGQLTVWMLYDYHETDAPGLLTLRCGEDFWQAEADGLYDNTKAGAGEAVYTFALDAMPEGTLLLTDGERECVLSMTGDMPAQTFTLGNGRYGVTLAQLTPESRLLAAQMEVVNLDPIAAAAKVVAFDLSDDSLWKEGHESRAFTDGGEYVLYAGNYGMKVYSPAGLAQMEERNGAGMHFSTGSGYVMYQLEQLEARGVSDVFTLDSPVREVRIERMKISAKSSAIGYTVEPEGWAADAFDCGRITVPAQNGGREVLAEPVTLRVGEGLTLVLHTVERMETGFGDQLFVDYTYTAEDGVELERLELALPGWQNDGRLEDGRICFTLEEDGETNRAVLPIALFGVGYSVPLA